MNNQAFSKIWFAIIIVVLLAGGFFAWQYFGAPKEEGKTPEIKDETANWKTYTNEGYGFEVRYPPTWTVGHEDGILPRYTIFSLELKDKASDQHFSIGINYMRTADFSEYVALLELEKRQEIIINGKRGFVGYYTNKFIVEGKPLEFTFKTAVLPFDDLSAITLTSGLETEVLFDQMLSTFKFIEKDETANWETYSSAKLGIDFKYPPNYIIMDRLNDEEKAILLGDKEFPKPDIAPWYHAPISISEYNEPQVNNQMSALFNIKRSTITIDGQTAGVIEGNYQDYPAPGMPAANHMKIITIPNKNLMISAQNSYADTKSNWNSISSDLENILTTIKFK